MPSFDVEFEVYCNTCGAGLCMESDTPRTRTRGALSVRVNACPSCIEKVRDEIEDKNKEIAELQERIEQLESCVGAA